MEGIIEKLEGSIFNDDEVLKIVFGMINGKDLASCMCVCKQWRIVAKEDYLWKKLCAETWPSMSKSRGPVGSSRGYERLYASLSKCKTHHRGPLPAPNLAFEDLEFYVDIWLDRVAVYSDIIPGAFLRSGLKNPISFSSSDVSFRSLTCKMTVPVNPKFGVVLTQDIHVSLLVGRKDKDKVACVIDKGGFDYVDGPANRALAFDYLRFAPCHPFVTDTRAWLALLMNKGQQEDSVDVFGIEVDFCDAANSDDEVLWLLDMLDWK